MLSLRIIHETNPRKYFPALYYLEQQLALRIVGEHRYSVCKEWLRASIKDKKPLWTRTKDAWGDLCLRLKIPFIRNEIILLGFAPWDFRLLYFYYLAKHNTIYYHTSWPHWGLDSVPRRYGVLTPILRKVWLRFLNKKNVHIIAVTEVAKISLFQATGIDAEHVIPHAVSALFFQQKRSSVNSALLIPVRLVYVGELSPKKGLLKLLEIYQALPANAFELTIIGDGVLRQYCHEQAASHPHIHYLGPIAERETLANILKQQDLLLLLSQKEKTWEELFGIVITEALACGLGVISSNHIGPVSIFDDPKAAALFDENDTQGIIALLNQCHQDRQYLNDFCSQYHHLADQYSVDSVATAWRNALTKVKVEH